MLDIGWSELLIIGIVMLLVVGPKDLPVFLRTLGKYFGAVKRQAAEFQKHFDDAMREAELDQLKKDVTDLRNEVEGTFRDTQKSIEEDVAEADRAYRKDPLAAPRSKAPESTTGSVVTATPPPAGSEQTAHASAEPPVAGRDKAPAPAPTDA